MLLAATSLLGGLAATAGAALVRFAERRRFDRDRVVTAIDALLPQTQCTQCGHPGCRPYAVAIADGAPIDLCPPGGRPLVSRLADLLGRSMPHPSPALLGNPPDDVAVIDEARCIGCALCLPACPTDAIVGAAQLMHTVIAAECTGCALCLPPCPVDCITIEPRSPVRAPIRASGPDRVLPCVHCGACADVCPVRLRPDLLHAARDASPADALMACIECGACDAACPSSIALKDGIAEAKARARTANAMSMRAERARSRYAAHEARIALVQSTAAARRNARLERRLGSGVATPAATTPDANGR